MYKFQIETPSGEDIHTRNNSVLADRLRQYYTSNIVGANIVNAATGDVYTDVIGTKAETKYFRVIDATGRYDENGRSVGQNANNPMSNKLFYLDREQYMQHRGDKFVADS